MNIIQEATLLATIGEQNKTILSKLETLETACQQRHNVVCLTRPRASPSDTHLENCTGIAQVPTKGDLNMAIHRLRVCIGFNDSDGSEVIKQVSGKSETDLADNIVRAMLCSERRHEFVNDSGKPMAEPQTIPTLHDYAEEWLLTYKEGKLKQTTLKGYKSILHSHLYPAFGNMPVDRITAKSIQQFLDERKGYSQKYLTEMTQLLSEILDSALRDNLVSDNYASDKRITNPSNKRKVREPVSKEVLDGVIAALDSMDEQAQKYAALLVYTGMRRGEILGLKYDDIDLQANEIHVCRNATYTNNQPNITTPKTASGVRDIPIAGSLLKYLLPLGKGYVIGGNDTPITLTTFRNMYKRIKKYGNLQHGETSHQFRHSMGTNLYDTGASIKTVQSTLGQSDFKTTADRYIHDSDELKREAIARLDKYLGK